MSKEEFKYGEVIFKLDKLLDKKNINRNQIIDKTGIRFESIQKFYNGTAKLIDIEVLAKLCEVLDCNIEDIIEYKK